jgi:uncharacterized protein (UPF0261 family)
VARDRHARPGEDQRVRAQGVASGAGFAALETMGYAFVPLIQTRGDLGTVDGILCAGGSGRSAEVHRQPQAPAGT